MLNNRKSLVSDSSPTYSLGPLETKIVLKPFQNSFKTVSGKNRLKELNRSETVLRTVSKLLKPF